MEVDIVSKQVLNDKASILLRGDGIMQINIQSFDELTVDDVKEITKAVGVIGEGKTYPNLVLLSHYFNPDKEVRSYAASEESNIYTLADAFVVKSLPVKIIGNFYVAFNKPVKPTKIFDSELEAVQWLKSFL